MSNTEDLKTRVYTRRQELIKKIRLLKDNDDDEADARRDAIKKRLSELGSLVKNHVANGWTSVDSDGKAKIIHWLER